MLHASTHISGKLRPTGLYFDALPSTPGVQNLCSIQARTGQGQSESKWCSSRPAFGQHQQQSNRSNGHDDNEGDHHQNDDYVQWINCVTQAGRRSLQPNPVSQPKFQRIPASQCTMCSLDTGSNKQQIVQCKISQWSRLWGYFGPNCCIIFFPEH